MKDINDVAAISGFSIDTVKKLEGTSKPCILDEEEIQYQASMRGVDCLKKIHSKIMKEKDPKKLKTHFNFSEKNLDEMGWAWIFSEDQMTPLLFQMTVPGIKIYVETLNRSIKRRARDHEKAINEKRLAEKREHQARRGEPNRRVLDLLSFKDNGKPYATKLNMETVLREDPRFAGMIQFCELDGLVHFKRKPVDDITEARTASLVASIYGFEMDDKKIGKIMSLIADEHKYHPVQEYLDTLTWDTKPRLKDLLPTYFSSPDYTEAEWDQDSGEWVVNESHIANPDGTYADYSAFGIDGPASIVQIYGIRFMIGAVARALDPGCKVDSLLCIIGPQGIGKSSAIAKIAVHSEWFSDTPFDVTKKDAYIQLMGKWIVELPECETLHRSGHNSAKSFLSSCVDRFRVPYRRHAIDVKRTSTMIATTNQTRLSFLSDVSGHRRFWVCRVDQCMERKLSLDIGQLWAEAKHYYTKQNEQHWLTSTEEKLRARLNENFREVDSWEEEICQWILEFYKRELRKDKSTPGFTIRQVLKGLNIQERDQRRAEQDRAGNVLARIGAVRWGRKKVGRAYSRLWCVLPPVFETLCEAYYHGISVDDETGEVSYSHQYLLDYIRKDAN